MEKCIVDRYNYEAICLKQIMMEVDEDPVTRKRRKAKERKDRWRAKQKPESVEEIRAKNNKSQKTRLRSLSPALLQAHRVAKAASEHQRVSHMSSAQLQAYRAANAASQQQHRERLNEALRREAINFNVSNTVQHDCGQFGGQSLNCQYCGTKHFEGERPSDGIFTSCCRKGKVMLPKPQDINGDVVEYPDFLRQLLSEPNHPNFKHFRDNIRSYNSAISFASLGANIMDLPGRGPYIFKIHGQTYHRTSHLQPVNAQAPQFAQLYVVDSTQATDVREGHYANENCKREILDQIDRFFRQHNRLAQTYQLIREVEAQEAARAAEAGDEAPKIKLIFKSDRRSNKHRYNLPTSNEIAMVFVNDDGEPPFKRDIQVYPINPEDPGKQFVNLSILSPNMDPMTYALLFPYDEAGWQPN